MYVKRLLTAAFFSCFLLLFTAHLQAQLDYDIADFKTPEVRYNGLDFGSFLYGVYSGFEDGDNRLADGRFNLDYFNYTNRDGYIGDHDVDFNAFWVYSRTDRENGEDISFSNSYTLHARSLNQFYYNGRSKNFIGLYGISSQQIRLNNSRSENPAERRNVLNYDSQSQLYLSYGHGRIEPITLARQAYDTYVMLALKDRLRDNPTGAQVDSLAYVMTRIVNTRFFDSRFKTIFQLEQIDSAIRETGLVEETDMVYFAQLTDVWLYANVFARGSGSQWEVGAAGDVLHDRFHQDLYEGGVQSQDHSYSNNYEAGGVYLFGAYENNKPLSVERQQDIHLLLYGGAEYYPDYSIVQDGFRATFRAAYEFGWFPNTRTSWQNEIVGILSYGQNPLKASEADYMMAYRAGLNSNLYYWLSPRFRVGGNARISYSTGYQGQGLSTLIDEPLNFFSSPQASDNFQVRLNLELSYALF